MTRTKGRALCSIVIAGLLTLTWLVPAGAQPQGPPHGRGGAGGWGLFGGIPLTSVTPPLTPEQWAQVKSITTAARNSRRSTMQDLRNAQKALIDQLLASPSADVSAQVANINTLRAQQLSASVATTAQVLAVLTPAQLASAAQLRTSLQGLRSQMQQLLHPGTQP